jgi:hypothetical protein
LSDDFLKKRTFFSEIILKYGLNPAVDRKALAATIKRSAFGKTVGWVWAFARRGLGKKGAIGRVLFPGRQPWPGCLYERGSSIRKRPSQPSHRDMDQIRSLQESPLKPWMARPPLADGK